MLTRYLLLSVLPLSLAACFGASSGGEADRAAPVMRQSHVIPVEYRGRWAESVAACLSDNSRRYEISAIRIDRPDFSGRVKQVELAGSDASVRLKAEGGEVDFRLKLENERTLRASYGTREPFELKLCR